MLFFAHFAQGELRRARPAARLSVGAAFPIYFHQILVRYHAAGGTAEDPKGR